MSKMDQNRLFAVEWRIVASRNQFAAGNHDVECRWIDGVFVTP